MSRADWSFLEHLLEEGQEYSTGIGRIWLTILFLFRMLVLGTAAESAWDDEQDDFVCNTRQPGCTPVCYDRAFPISHFRYFVLQVIFVSTPTIFYFGYVAIRAGKIKGKEEDEEKEAGGGGGNKRGEIETGGGHKDGGKGRKASEAPKLKGRLLCMYAFSILLKVLLEAGFIVGLWILYGGFFIPAKFECTGFPCPHTVDCFVSRPTEKTIFTIYIQVIAAISLLLNLLELLHLLQLAITHHLEKYYRSHHPDRLPPADQAPSPPTTAEIQTDVLQSYKAGGHVQLPLQGEAVRYSNPCESSSEPRVEVVWGAQDAASDPLPSCVNYMVAMKTSHSPHANFQKQDRHSVNNCKSAHKGQSKRKHYV